MPHPIMKEDPHVSRRSFAKQLILSTTALASSSGLGLAAPPASKRRIIAFSKPFQKLNFEDTADLVAEVGWNGIECPVRKNGHVLPERAAEDLPRMHDALKRRGLDVTMITTDVRKAEPATEELLRVAAKLGIKWYRLSYWKYRAGASIPEQLREIHAQLKDLAALNGEIGICGCFQNHSGSDQVGAPVWDIHELIKGFDTRHLACCFDIGHATLEGGQSWPIQARLMKPFAAVYYVKDLQWKKNAEGWKAEWCPLGEGIVQPSFFRQVNEAPVSVPISQHHEYPLGTQKQMIAAMKKDLAVLNSWLS